MNQQLPIRIVSKVVRGYGRGSKDLGIPTANISRDHLTCSIGSFDDLPTGIYWGYARIIAGESSSEKDGQETKNNNKISGRDVYTAAVSIGYNPTYNNKEKTVEPHLIAESSHPQRHASSTGETMFSDFYDTTIVLSVVGYLRPELPFEGLEKLTLAIKKDIEDACSLAKEDNTTNKEEKEWVLQHQQ
mmetsp:Transcript_8712/g.14316  ORF Transcript_8712/g.14316 Transcript_8712/m.14316 type:complete len:188 (+) Transcript_8712:92-655(+)